MSNDPIPRIEALEARVSALEQSSVKSSASTLAKLSRANPSAKQREASRINGLKGGRPKAKRKPGQEGEP